LARCSTVTVSGLTRAIVSAICVIDSDWVIWLKTRNSPGSAGFSQASWRQRTVSLISMMPRTWLPLP